MECLGELQRRLRRRYAEEKENKKQDRDGSVWRSVSRIGRPDTEPGLQHARLSGDVRQRILVPRDVHSLPRSVLHPDATTLRHPLQHRRLLHDPPCDRNETAKELSVGPVVAMECLGRLQRELRRRYADQKQDQKQDGGGVVRGHLSRIARSDTKPFLQHAELLWRLRLHDGAYGRQERGHLQHQRQRLHRHRQQLPSTNLRLHLTNR